MSKWEKIEAEDAEMWDFEKDGEELMGKLVDIRLNVGPNNSAIYTLRLEDGENRNFWGTTILDTRLKNVELGDMVKIVFLGRETSEKSGRTYKNFDVFKKSGEEEVSPDEIPDFEENNKDG